MVIEIKTTAQLRNWGNSLGLVIPKEEAVKAGLAAGAEVEITVRPATKLHGLFGSVRLSTPTAKLLRDVDDELDPDRVRRR